VATLTFPFAGAGIEAGSLADGSYRLEIDPTKLADADGLPIDLTGDGLADLAPAGVLDFHRLFGDSDGNQILTAAEKFDFLRRALNKPAAYATYAHFDFDGDGDIDQADYDEFLDRYNAQ
jgi:hypothetical protein